MSSIIRLIIGIPRMGKTTLARELIRASDRSILIDPFPVPSATHEVYFAEDDTEGIDFESGKFKIGWHDTPDWELFQSLSNVEIVNDDPDGESWKGNQVRDPYLRKIITQHGHYNQSLTIVTQRFTLIPPLVIDMAGEVYLFALNGVGEVKRARDQWGIVAPTEPLTYRAWFRCGHKPATLESQPQKRVRKSNERQSSADPSGANATILRFQSPPATPASDKRGLPSVGGKASRPSAQS